MNQIGLIAALAIGIGACGSSGRRASPADSPVATPPPAPVSSEILRDLAVLATGKPLSDEQLEDVAARIGAGTLDLEVYVDELLQHPGFAETVAPRMLLRAAVVEERSPMLSPYLLRTIAADDGTSIYTRGAPCDPAKAVNVEPWWAPGRAVRVCPEVVRADAWDAQVSVAGESAACNSQFGATSPACGCGPHLIRCAPDPQRFTSMSRAARDEVRDTVAYITRHDRPLREVFTSNATFRGPDVERLYRNERIEAARGEGSQTLLGGLDAWPSRGQWAPRFEAVPGQHAGILTTPQVLHTVADRRQRMVIFYELAWCMGADSTGASVEAILALGSTTHQFVQDAWKELAARPLCTNCHARMEYGWQYFTGYPDGRMARHFRAELVAKGQGPFYGRDISDERGHAALTPRGFAQLAVSQPEFARCMARDVAGHVFGPNAPRGLEAKLAARVQDEPRTTARALMRDALLAYARDRATAASPTEPAFASSPAPVPPGEDAVVTLDGELGRLVTDHCLDCHDDAVGLPSFSSKTVSRATALAMLSSVSSGAMPKGAPLAPQTRDAFIAAAVGSVWSRPIDQKLAYHAMSNQLGGVPVHDIRAALRGTASAAGAEGPGDWKLIEDSVHADLLTLTPGFAATLSLAALEACNAAGHTGPALEICLRRAFDLDRLQK